MEGLQSIQLFAQTDQLNRLAGNSLYGKHRTTAGITIELGNNQAVNAQFLVKALGNSYCVLTGHSIYNQQNFLRMNSTLNVAQLFHQLFIYM